MWFYSLFICFSAWHILSLRGDMSEERDFLEEDFLSNWTCILCKIKPTFRVADYLYGQYIVYEQRVLVDSSLEIYLKCCTCGAVQHAKCANITGNTVISSLEHYVCRACIGAGSSCLRHRQVWILLFTNSIQEVTESYWTRRCHWKHIS